MGVVLGTVLGVVLGVVLGDAPFMLTIGRSMVMQHETPS